MCPWPGSLGTRFLTRTFSGPWPCACLLPACVPSLQASRAPMSRTRPRRFRAFVLTLRGAQIVTLDPATMLVTNAWSLKGDEPDLRSIALAAVSGDSPREQEFTLDLRKEPGGREDPGDRDSGTEMVMSSSSGSSFMSNTTIVTVAELVSGEGGPVSATVIVQYING